MCFRSGQVAHHLPRVWRSHQIPPMKNEITTSQAYLEADKMHNDLIHQAGLEYWSAREAWNTAWYKGNDEEKQKMQLLLDKACNKMKAAKAARTKALNKILKAG